MVKILAKNLLNLSKLLIVSCSIFFPLPPHLNKESHLPYTNEVPTQSDNFEEEYLYDLEEEDIDDLDEEYDDFVVEPKEEYPTKLIASIFVICMAGMLLHYYWKDTSTPHYEHVENQHQHSPPPHSNQYEERQQINQDKGNIDKGLFRQIVKTLTHIIVDSSTFVHAKKYSSFIKHLTTAINKHNGRQKNPIFDKLKSSRTLEEDKAVTSFVETFTSKLKEEYTNGPITAEKISPILTSVLYEHSNKFSEESEKLNKLTEFIGLAIKDIEKKKRILTQKVLKETTQKAKEKIELLNNFYDIMEQIKYHITSSKRWERYSSQIIVPLCLLIEIIEEGIELYWEGIIKHKKKPPLNLFDIPCYQQIIHCFCSCLSEIFNDETKEPTIDMATWQKKTIRILLLHKYLTVFKLQKNSQNYRDINGKKYLTMRFNYEKQAPEETLEPIDRMSILIIEEEICRELHLIKKTPQVITPPRRINNIPIDLIDHTSLQYQLSHLNRNDSSDKKQLKEPMRPNLEASIKSIGLRRQDTLVVLPGGITTSNHPEINKLLKSPIPKEVIEDEALPKVLSQS